MVSKQFYQDIDMVNIGQLIGARHQNVNNADMTAMVTRSEERRVGKEC